MALLKISMIYTVRIVVSTSRFTTFAQVSILVYVKPMLARL
jgi:hypothetical protein